MVQCGSLMVQCISFFAACDRTDRESGWQTWGVVQTAVWTQMLNIESLRRFPLSIYDHTLPSLGGVLLSFHSALLCGG